MLISVERLIQPLQDGLPIRIIELEIGEVLAVQDILKTKHSLDVLVTKHIVYKNICKDEDKIVLEPVEEYKLTLNKPMHKV